MTMMKTLAFAGAMAVMAGTGYAATVSATHKSTSGITSGLSIRGTGVPLKSVHAGELSMLGTAGAITGNFAAFCVDLATNLASGSQTYHVNNNLFGSAVVSKVQTLFDANYSATLSALDNAAFQIALWSTLDSGFTYDYTGGSANILNNKVSQFKNATYSGPSLWDLTFLVGNPQTQNLVAVQEADVAPVPLPAAGLLLLGGLGGLGIVARRRNKTA